MNKIVVTTLFILTASIVNAQIDKLSGYWISIDDETGRQESVFYIYKATDGKYYGKLTELLLPDHKGALCIKCEGTDKNKPVEGMLIIRGMNEEDDNLVGGTVLEPKSGKTYNCKITYDKKNDRLKLRGSIDKRGFIGRTQYWIRKK